MHPCAIQNNGNDEALCRAGIETQTESRVVDTAGKGKGGTNGESNNKTHTYPYVKPVARGNLLYDAGNSNLVLCDNLEG